MTLRAKRAKSNPKMRETKGCANKMNLPNKLSVFRIILVPFFMFFIACPVAGENTSRIIAAAIFLVASITDLIDGKIARKYNLITDFGKFIDPLADKFLVFGAIITMLSKYTYLKGFTVVAAIVIFRELAVTSMRLLVVNSSGKVIAASMLGKIKTVSQIVCILTILLEPVIFSGIDIFAKSHVLSYVMMCFMAVTTLWSGIDYLVTYLPAINSKK